MVMSKKEWDEKIAGAMMKKMKATEYAIMSEDRSRRELERGTSAVCGDKPLPGSEISRR